MNKFEQVLVVEGGPHVVGPPLWTDRLIDWNTGMTKNITFPKTTYASGNKKPNILEPSDDKNEIPLNLFLPQSSNQQSY